MIGVHCLKDFTCDLDGGPESVHTRLAGLLPDADVYCLKQVHGSEIVLARDEDPGVMPEADGIISLNPEDVLCIRTADCVPVLLWASSPDMIGAVHAGWRGLAKGIVKKAVHYMQELGACEIRASIGPCIGVCCYEVGMDVVDGIGREHLVTRNGSMFMDLAGVALSQACESGVARHMIHTVCMCTSCHPDKLFSYRRDGAGAGRNISLIGGKSWSLPGLQVG